MKDLQDQISAWHHAKYTHAPIERIGLKLGEEAGEVCRAIDRIIHAKTFADEDQWRNQLTEEIGDSVIVLMVLCARNNIDFEATVRSRAAEVMAR